MTTCAEWSLAHGRSRRCAHPGCRNIIRRRYSSDGCCYVHTSDQRRLAKIERRAECREARLAVRWADEPERIYTVEVGGR